MNPVRLPANLGMVGLVVDRDNEKLVGPLIQRVKSRAAVGLLAAWRRMPEFPFLVLAGELHRERAGVVGGMARTREDALALFRLATERLDEIAAHSGVGFTSAWLLLVREDFRRDFDAASAAAQQTAGSA